MTMLAEIVHTGFPVRLVWKHDLQTRRRCMSTLRNTLGNMCYKVQGMVPHLQSFMGHDGTMETYLTSKPHHHQYHYLVPLQSAPGSRAIAAIHENY